MTEPESEIQPCSSEPQNAPAEGARKRNKKQKQKLTVKDVVEFIDATDIHVVFLQTVQKSCRKVWDRIPDARKAMDVAEAALDRYNDTVEKFLEGTEADNDADKDSAKPVTEAGFQAIKKAADPLVNSVDALKKVIDQEKSRLTEKVYENRQGWEKRFDNCLYYAAMCLFLTSLLYTIMAWMNGELGEDVAAQAANSQATASAEAAATIEDEF